MLASGRLGLSQSRILGGGAATCAWPPLDSAPPRRDNPDVADLILIVEDDPSLREVITMALEGEGFRVASAPDGPAALMAFATHTPVLVLLDLMLPTLDGLRVCEEIRRVSQVPIIILTARSSTDDVVRGLEAGADDYVTKPFQLPELLARIRSVLRRAAIRSLSPPDTPCGPLPGATAPSPRTTRASVLTLGPLVIDAAAHRVIRRAPRSQTDAGDTSPGQEISLTVTEFRLLYELARHAGRVLTREQLLELVWGYSYLGDSRLVDVHIQRLRAKIEADPSQPTLIVTVRGVGYRAESPPRS